MNKTFNIIDTINNINKHENEIHNDYHELCNLIYDKMKELEIELPKVDFILINDTKKLKSDIMVSCIIVSPTKLDYIIKFYNINKMNEINENSLLDKMLLQLMDDLCISKDNYTIVNIIFTILHELGHVYFAKTYIAKNKLVNKFNYYLDIDESQIQLLFYEPEMEEKEKFRLYRLKRYELFADNFAYKYFYTIWKYLNEVYIK